MSLHDLRSFTGASKMLVDVVTNAFFETAVQMVIEAYKYMCSDKTVNSGWKETKFSHRIVYYMREYKRTHDLKLNVYPEIPCPDEEMLGGGTDPDTAPRIDILVRHLSMPEEIYITFECKRLDSRNSSLQREYVTEGILRFVSGKYGKTHRYGGMIGFIISGEIANLVASINQRIIANASLGQIHCLKCKTCNGNIYSSTHVRNAPLPDIQLRHVFCPFVFK